ncbi:minor capsid protein, partial [Streptococcus pneumoniae]|uniref:minor capsid protein n=1 Tax=Streptococcus pneumoniae TaxID=1313 RepID=UPI000FC09A28
YKHTSLGGKSTTKGKNLTPCAVCQGLNGQIFHVKNMKRGKNAPTMHPNCRCSTVPVIG